MKKYLSQGERRDMVVLSALAGKVEEMTGEWAARGNLTEEEQATLRAGITAVEHGLDLIFARFPLDVVKQTHREATTNEVLVVSKARVEIEEQREAKFPVHFTAEGLDILAAAALSQCSPCICKDRHNCELKKVFLETGVEVYDEEAEECPYLIRERVEDA